LVSANATHLIAEIQILSKHHPKLIYRAWSQSTGLLATSVFDPQTYWRIEPLPLPWLQLLSVLLLLSFRIHCLTEHLRAPCSFQVFKSSLKTHLFRQAFDSCDIHWWNNLSQNISFTCRGDNVDIKYTTTTTTNFIHL